MPPVYDDILPPLTSEDKMMSGMCYPFWMVVPFFVLASSKREDPFLAFHALQGLAIGVLTSILSVVGLLILWVVYSSLPTSYMMTSGLIGVVLLVGAMAFGALSFCLSIFLGWQASAGRFLRMAGVGDWCEAKMAQMLGLTAKQLRQMAIDRELVPDEKVTIIAPVSTPEQLSAEMDRWAQQPNWWGSQAAAPAAESAAPPQTSAPVREAESWRPPVAEPKPAAAREATPWRPPVAETPARPSAAESVESKPTHTPEVKPWRPASATPQTKPVSFPSVKKREAEEKPKKWWAPENRQRP
jgi:uncharacterized membrane protein